MGWTYTALTEKSEAKLIEITTDDGSLVFVNGTSSSSKTLSVVAEGFTPVSYKWEKKNGDNWTTISGATNSSYTITGVENVGTYRATAYEDANTGYYDIITIASVSDGQGGSSPYLFSLSNENFTINTTNDLKPTTSLNYEVKVTGYHGSSVMTPIASGTPTAEQFKIKIPSGSIFSLKTGTTDTLVYAANTSTALSNENLAETITITYDTNKSETKTITISCAKNGISPTVTQGTGSVTITDASGHTGTVNDGHSPSVTATKTDGVTSVKVDGTQIATISDGATGKNALQPNRNWTSTYTTVNQTTTCGTDDFNRTPVVGDTFTNLDGSSNTGTWQVTAISGTTVTIKLLSYVNSKGAKGDTGASFHWNLLPSTNELTKWVIEASVSCTKLSEAEPKFRIDDLASRRGGHWGIYLDNVSLKNVPYTLSYKAAGPHQISLCPLGSFQVLYSISSASPTSETEFKATFTPEEGTFRIYIHTPAERTQDYFDLGYLKLEEGSTASDWCTTQLETKGDTGVRGATYRGTATSAPSSPVNGDYYFNTSTGYIQTYNGSSWANDTMDVTNFHVLDAINDIISWCASNTSHSMYNTNKGLADSYVDKLLVGTALINKLFAKQITLQTGGVIQSSDYSTTAGFKIDANGNAEFNGNSLAINGINIFATLNNDLIIGKSDFLNSGSFRSSNIFIGEDTGLKHTSGIGNIAIGHGAMENKTQNNTNIAIGNYAMHTLTQATGSIAIGNEALGYGSSSSANIAVGNQAGRACEGNKNIFIGNGAGKTITTGNNNIIIGNNIGGASSTSNLINIGDKIKHESGVLYSADSNGTFKRVFTEADGDLNKIEAANYVNNISINWRGNLADYYTTTSYQTAGNEALVFATKNAVTSFMFVNGEDSVTNHDSNRWQSLTPALQIKNNCVSIGELIANGVTPTYKLNVNGRIHGTVNLVAPSSPVNGDIWIE